MSAVTAKRAFADGWASTWDLAAASGTRAAAEAAWHPGHRCESVADLQAELEQILGGARQKAGAA